MPLALATIHERLRQSLGPQSLPPARSAFEHVLWENCAYLVDDARRGEVFAALAKAVGLTAAALLRAPAERIENAIARGGMHPARRAARLIECAELCAGEHGGDLDLVCARPEAEALREFARYPGIGKPGAARILLLTRHVPGLPLDSNGLRTLVRLGFGREERSYAATYRSVERAVAPEVGSDFATLIALHLLLRAQGQEVCRRTHPECERCPLRRDCPGAVGAAPPTARPRRRPGTSR